MKKLLLLLPLFLLLSCQSSRVIDPKTQIQIDRSKGLLTLPSKLRALKNRSQPDVPFPFDKYRTAILVNTTISPDGQKATVHDAYGKHIHNFVTDSKRTFYSYDICDEGYVRSFSYWLDADNVLAICKTYGEKVMLYRINVESWRPYRLTKTPAFYYIVGKDKDKKYLYVASTIEDGKYLDVLEINWQTRETKKIFDNTNKDLSPLIVRNGEVVSYAEKVGDKYDVYYGKQNQYKKVLTLAREDSFKVYGNAGSPNQFYVSTDLDRNSVAIGIFDFLTGKLIRVLSQRSELDRKEFVFSSEGIPFVVGYNPDIARKRYDFLSDTLADSFDKAKAAFAQEAPNAVRIDIRDTSDDQRYLQ